ncbi:MucB/RseB C-terminal domain-containing protein [Actinomadura kijaniata]|uniref:MucB/RseB C-terminal domain-containing protein n=1 Tax=Actinomadura kijaniata TaxID=46161 RepID=UPI00083274D7|nr:MucB/RseB C-terminal domain-containing protein [Actinomadura kijaniata]
MRPPIHELRGAALPAAGMAGALLLAGLLSGDACADSRARRGDPEALRLLTAAVDAARNVAYEGTRTLATWSPDQASTAQVKVVHTPGAGTSFTDEKGPRGHRPDAGAAEAGLTASALALLARNYRLIRAADGTVCGRRARVVEAHRPGGGVAGRFWLDADTGLLLRRELVDAAGRRIAESGFIDLRVTRPPENTTMALRSSRAPATDVGAVSAARPWADHLDGGELAALRAAGWRIPDTLPGRLRLNDARRSDGRDVLHLTYTDGLATVSVFVQRGVLDDRRLAGWKRGPRAVYSRDALRQWALASDGEHVYTVVTEAPESTAVTIARALPPDRSAVRSRLARGARRIASWVNPFD